MTSNSDYWMAKIYWKYLDSFSKGFPWGEHRILLVLSEPFVLSEQPSFWCDVLSEQAPVAPQFLVNWPPHPARGEAVTKTFEANRDHQASREYRPSFSLKEHPSASVHLFTQWETASSQRTGIARQITARYTGVGILTQENSWLKRTWPCGAWTSDCLGCK